MAALLAGERAWPGMPLAHAGEVTAGEGTYVWGAQLHAAVAGIVVLGGESSPPTVSVLATARGASASAQPPAVGDLVTCRVARLNPRIASLDILCLGGVPLREACTGLLRREDVRGFEKDKVEMYSSCRPGDVVQARVISLGDSRAYYVTTASDELGVVFAQSAEEGTTMVPVSYDEMMCPVTHSREPRKVAKPVGVAVNTVDSEKGNDDRGMA
jgi:exosome complex component CSL4